MLVKRNRLKARKISNRGVTLIEVLVATLILATLAVPLLSAMVSTTRINVKTRQRQDATSMSQDFMEAIKAESLRNIDAKVQDAITNNTDLVFGGKTITVSQILLAETVANADPQFIDQYTYQFDNVNGFDVTIIAERDMTYGDGGSGKEEYAAYQLPQYFKYRITIEMCEDGSTEVFSTVTGTSLELLMVTYEEETEAETE